MVRGAAILLILTLFMQANRGSIFGQISSQRGDRAQMLKYMRERLNLDGSTTVQPGFNKRAEAWIPSTAKSEKIWERKPLPVSTFTSRDKSKMLARLRGVQTPSSIYNNANEHQESVSKNNDDQNVKTQDLVNDFVSVEQSEESEQQPKVLWEKPEATHVTHLQPAVKDKDGGTCYWHGQQHHQERLVQDMDGRLSLKKSEKYDIDNWEDYVQETWKCVEKKFWISYDKIKQKICGMFS